jgi:hypothetical protein
MKARLLVLFVCISLVAVAALAGTSLRSGGRTMMTRISSTTVRRSVFLNTVPTFDVRQCPL